MFVDAWMQYSWQLFCCVVNKTYVFVDKVEFFITLLRLNVVAVVLNLWADEKEQM